MAESRLVWIDLEMTGLYPDENTIIEIATIVTETDLSIVAEGPSFAIDVGKEELAKMDDWNVKHHTENGLLARIESEGFDSKAELETLEFLKQYCSPGQSPLCATLLDKTDDSCADICQNYTTFSIIEA